MKSKIVYMLSVIFFTMSMDVLAECKSKNVSYMLDKLAVSKKSIPFLPVITSAKNYKVVTNKRCYSNLVEVNESNKSLRKTYIFNKNDEFVQLSFGRDYKSDKCDEQKKILLSNRDVKFYSNLVKTMRDKDPSLPRKLEPLVGEEIRKLSCQVSYLEKGKKDGKKLLRIWTFDINNDVYDVGQAMSY